MNVIADPTRQAVVTDLKRYKRSSIKLEVWCAGPVGSHIGQVHHVDEHLLVLKDSNFWLITLVLDHVTGWTFA